MKRLRRRYLQRLIRSGRTDYPQPEELAARVAASLSPRPGAGDRAGLRRARVLTGAAVLLLIALPLLILRPHLLRGGGHTQPRTSTPARQSAREQAHSAPLARPTRNSPAAVAPRAAARRPVGARPIVPRPSTATSRRDQPAPPRVPGAPLLALLSAHPPITDGTGRALSVGDRLPAGARIATGPGGRATFITRRGSELTLGERSDLTLAKEGHRATLHRGRIYCRNRDHEFTQISTTAGEIRLLGTALDAEVQPRDRVAVTVVEGQVELANAHGEALVGAGRKAVLVASLPPDAGAPANATAETAWYDGRGSVVSDFGEIAYLIRRDESLAHEVWTMAADGSERRRVKTYLGEQRVMGPWLPGEPVLFMWQDSLLFRAPDSRTRKAHGYEGAPILGFKDRHWRVDAATGLDGPLGSPESLTPIGRPVLSPEAKKVVVWGYKAPDAEDPAEGSGLWCLDLRSGAFTRLMELNTTIGEIAWAPDSSALIVPCWEIEYQRERMYLVNAVTGEMVDLDTAGLDPAFSPDGDYFAYVSNFGDGVGNHHGSVWVRGLAPGSQPYRVSPEEAGTWAPSWSPDGTRLLYYVLEHPTQEEPTPDSRICVAAADGSGAQEIFRGQIGFPHWAPSGEAVYVPEEQGGFLLVAADGSGVIADLGGTAADSYPTPAQQRDTEGALRAAQEAVYQYAVGKWEAYQGQVRASKEAYAAAARQFAALPWSYPNADLSVGNVMLYADAARARADQSPEQMISDACATHLSHLAWVLQARMGQHLPLPGTLEDLLTWASTQHFSFDYWLQSERDDLRPMLRCPEGDAYLYTPTPAGQTPEQHALVLTCPRHPQFEVRWEVGAGYVNASPPTGSSFGGRLE